MASDGVPEPDRSASTVDERGDNRAGGRPRLACRTVRRPDGPDRWTVYPADATGVPRMSTWLSVDASCVVDLESVR